MKPIEVDSDQQQLSSGESRPTVTVVIPVFNGGHDLDRCLSAVFRSNWPDIECIVVDDASTDGLTTETARRHGARLITLDKTGGPGRARSLGVSAAGSEIVFFTDSDVVLHPDAISIGMGALSANPEIAAVFGSYDDEPADPRFLSQYRNLLHHWTHQSGPEAASTFWTGCGAIRRDVFLKLNAFSPEFQQPSIEDIEFGYRMTELGHQIRLLKNMQGTHLKVWRFWKMVATDIFRRGVPWMMLLLRHPNVPAHLNVDLRSRVATIFAGLLPLALTGLVWSGHWRACIPSLALMVASTACTYLTAIRGAPAIRDFLSFVMFLCTIVYSTIWSADAWAFVPLSMIAGIVAANMGFFRFLKNRRGWAFALGAVSAQVIFYLGCVIAIPLGGLAHLRSRSRLEEGNRGSGLRSGNKRV